MATSIAVNAPLGGAEHRISEGWELLLTPPGLFETPAGLPETGFVSAPVPGTVASALRALGRSPLDSPQDLDAQDAWYRCRFDRPAVTRGARVRLCFDGLASLADVYLNGDLVVASDNMFVRHSVDVTDALGASNQLAIRFKALGPELKRKKGRPRWRTKLVEQQQLRFFRTTLLGRTPGFCPSVAPVGPFRPVRLEVCPHGLVSVLDVRSTWEQGVGVVSAHLKMHPPGERRLESASLVVGDQQAALSLAADPSGVIEARGELRIPGAPLWWPHTHGPSPLFDAEIVVHLAGGEVMRHPLGRIGFRTIALDTTSEGFAILVNGEPVFCRGACWTPLDLLSLSGTPGDYRRALELARDAGMNMMRVGGTMLYEDDAFYDACDELGILVWQDFMFANMDYPGADDGFVASVEREVADLLGRLRFRPSTTVFCGNSEVEQQAAMLGLPRQVWRNELFSAVIPAMVNAACPGVPYCPSSPSGGSLPFQVSAGVSHYYGVGAYQRPFEDARRANVRFCSECLAFANVPEATTLDKILPEGAPPVHHPAWKARVPRDRGAGWDFDDVRDHYLERIFGVSARDLRYGDHERYLELSRVASGEAMHRTFSEWRRPGSSCRGGLVWFYRDFWPGAGWGVVDSTGCPKAAYWHLRRILQPRALLVSDEGLDGLVLHAVNDCDVALEAELKTTLYRHGQTPVVEATARALVPARGSRTVGLQSQLETFVDTTYSYRFGPPSHDLVVATLTDVPSGEGVAAAFYFPLGLPSSREADVGLEATAESADEGTVLLSVATKRFAQSVRLDLDGGVPDDNYFHLAPGGRKTIRVKRTAGAPFQGEVRALNAHAVARVRCV